MILKYSLLRFGIKLNGSFEEAAASNFYDVVKAFTGLSVDVFQNKVKSPKGFNHKKWLSDYEKVVDLDNLFVEMHEGEHRLSFIPDLDRPPTKEFKNTAAAILNLLLQQAETDKHDGFWVAFKNLNFNLEDCLSRRLALEEMRATIRALEKLTPQFQQRMIEKVYPETRNDREAELFRWLRSVTGGNWLIAWYLTLEAEFINPERPEYYMKEQKRFLNGVDANTWSVAQWVKWLAKCSDLDKVSDFILEFPKDPLKWYEALLPSAFIYGFPNEIKIVCPDPSRLQVFLESMRQQLAQLIFQPEHVSSVICPFKGQSDSCCGFGHNLQGIWAAIPNEERSRLKPPSTVCLKDALV